MMTTARAIAARWSAFAAIQRLPVCDAVPSLVETLTASTPRGPIRSRIHHDHLHRVLAARAAQRIAGAELMIPEWLHPSGLTTATPPVRTGWYTP